METANEYGHAPGSQAKREINRTRGLIGLHAHQTNEDLDTGTLKQLVNLATNHFNFWMPFAFDYLVAPFMGVLFYCSMKGEAWFPACMERVYLGTQPPPWTPGSDPWAAIAPPDAKSNVGPVAITLGSAALSMLASV